jgi:hypothetical protein
LQAKPERFCCPTRRPDSRRAPTRREGRELPANAPTFLPASRNHRLRAHACLSCPDAGPAGARCGASLVLRRQLGEGIAASAVAAGWAWYRRLRRQSDQAMSFAEVGLGAVSMITPLGWIAAAAFIVGTGFSVITTTHSCITGKRPTAPSVWPALALPAWASEREKSPRAWRKRRMLPSSSGASSTPRSRQVPHDSLAERAHLRRRSTTRVRRPQRNGLVTRTPA